MTTIALYLCTLMQLDVFQVYSVKDALCIVRDLCIETLITTTQVISATEHLQLQEEMKRSKVNVVVLNGHLRLDDSSMMNAVIQQWQKEGTMTILLFIKERNQHKADFDLCMANKMRECEQITYLEQKQQLQTLTQQLNIDTVYHQSIVEIKQLIKEWFGPYSLQIKEYNDYSLILDDLEGFSNSFERFYTRAKNNVLKLIKSKGINEFRQKGILVVQGFSIKKSEKEYPTQIKIWRWFKKNIQYYNDSRNIFSDLFDMSRPFSSFQSAFLSSGVVSVRFLYWDVKRSMLDASTTTRKNANEYIRELFWRTFCEQYYAKHGSALLNQGGLYKRKVKYVANPKLIEAINAGNTKDIVINGIIKQLKTQGFVCNRLRMVFANWCSQQRLSWYDVIGLFEDYLIDYYYVSNLFGWLFSYNLTFGQPHNFSTQRQLKKYDPSHQWLDKWT